METQQIKEEFKQILADVMKDGVSPDEAHSSARIILQESGKDRRTILMNQSRQNGNAVNGNGNDASATPRQLNALKKFGVSHEAGISKAEASKLLDPFMKKFKAQNGQQ